VDASLGQAIFNDTLPKGYPFVREQADKGKLSQIVNKLAEEYPKVEVAASLDRIKDAGFYWATRSGVTVALSDVLTPPNKGEIIAKYEKQAQKVQGQFEKGLVTDAERRQEQIKIWTEATDEVQAAMKANFPADNTINRMVSSGARGNWLQIRNIAGIRGLVNNTKGEIMPRPIISSYREGLSVAEYFTATHGARKGLADTALRTADSGYLTRRLVDVSQDVIIREDDCGTSKGLEFTIAAPGADGTLVRDANVENSVFARTLAAEVVAPSGEVVAEAGDDVGDVLIDKLVAAGVETIKVRSVLTCDSAVGVCAKCYGRSLATGKLVDIGEAVGIIAAQSIGEPGTQLTMRTFHTGGSAPTTSPRVCPACRSCSRRVPQGCVPDRRGRRSHHDRRDRQGQEGHPDARQRRRAARLPRPEARDAPGRGRPARHGRPADPGRHARPQGGHARHGRPRGAEVPRRRRAGRLPLAGCADPRQAHRGHRAPDAAEGHRGRPRRHDAAAG
jgi:DNA-directed RNA polymerase subunit beta'